MAHYHQVSFPKGLAHKLITKDFGNQSFRVDLPSSLRQRGVHNVFHSSLLCVHHPNDDQLFPGRLESQLGAGDLPDHEGEWAIDKILSHSGSREESIFEILWKSGDITWLLYETIQDLPALKGYLELLGIEKIADLRKGQGKPPRDDPQVFLGIMEYIPYSPIPPKAPTISGKLTGKITSVRARYYAVILPKSLTLRELRGYLPYFVIKFFENR